MLKFEEKFKIGQVVKAYDFRPREGVNQFVQGVIVQDRFETPEGVNGYLIEVQNDSGEDFITMHNRVETMACVPFEIFFGEFDERIQLVQEA